MAKTNLLIYKEQYESIRELTQVQKGLLLDAICMYEFEGELIEINDNMVVMAFSFFKTMLDVNRTKYEMKCARNRENASKGGKQKVANASEGKQTLPKKDKVKKVNKVANASESSGYDTDTDTDTDNDTDMILKQKRKDTIPTVKKIIKESNLPKETEQLINTWIQYKKERKDKPYKKTGLTQLINKMVKHIDEYGIDKMTDVMSDTMASNYMGIVWDKFNKQGGNGNGTYQQEHGNSKEQAERAKKEAEWGIITQ